MDATKALQEPEAPQTEGATDLIVQGLRVQFGGLVAVDDVTLTARSGQITGLIGPNGAGKTTTFNACTGLIRATAGTVALGDQRIDRLSTARRAQSGLGRTFQRMELFDTMTVRENVGLGREIRLAGGRWSRRLFSAPAEQAECIERAGRAIDDCGLTHLSDRLVGDLSTGQRRLVELARALAGGFRLFLLDEPSSGLDATETRRFGELLAKVVERDRVGILLVEHDMTLVRSVCTYVYVLDFGKLIYEGTVVEVTQSDIVKAAYLGSALARTD